jgi:4-hydroxybutyrate CoA-transferase
VKPRIRIKYCGGCNPGYDRSRLVEQMKIRLKDGVEWVSSETESYDLVIAIQGCETSCADLTEFEGHDVHIINCFEDADTMIGRISAYNAAHPL